uniref:Uncharacterized protein n=1 Tax=Chromera velia CCMP2878 TaxID=1169474 RepID=A0A0G4G4Y6_9ALVE|eukprot:Cvel_20190.t1-p1 / transcript=Cvel_20190.t1 / gene=Cvel_20190 / organism=Chromera_velia_CCMP2878 / gene_product=hypothetical protein / transcript_product=hypothetical protein / location=Cvel_scaffold1795:28710-35033(-) / protein_length=84 / sequence_SO=supercontig / SO=protein_coding / is_pseudo=false
MGTLRILHRRWILPGLVLLTWSLLGFPPPPTNAPISSLITARTSFGAALWGKFVFGAASSPLVVLHISVSFFDDDIGIFLLCRD